MSEENIERTIGNIEGRMEAFDGRITRIEGKLDAMDTKLDNMANLLAEQQARHTFGSGLFYLLVAAVGALGAWWHNITLSSTNR